MEKKNCETITGNKAVSYVSGNKEIARSVFTDEGITVNIRGTSVSYRVESLSQSDVIVQEWNI